MTLGIGLVGYGGIGRVHAMGYRAIPFYYGLPANTFKLVGVSTSRPETAEKAAREIGDAHQRAPAGRRVGRKRRGGCGRHRLAANAAERRRWDWSTSQAWGLALPTTSR
jgi:hypothetical protein